jgi:hypothetical protein
MKPPQPLSAEMVREGRSSIIGVFAVVRFCDIKPEMDPAATIQSDGTDSD